MVRMGKLKKGPQQMFANKCARIGEFGVRVLSGVIALCVVTGPFAVSVELQARPVSLQVKKACVRDYRKFCSSHPVGSSQLRGCMRSNGRRLSDRCVKALVAAGEISANEVERQKAAQQ